MKKEEIKTKTTQDFITEVRFDRTFNLGNYESLKIGLVATIGPENPDVAKTLRALDRATSKYCNEYYADRIGGKPAAPKSAGSKYGPGGEDDPD